MRLSYRLASLAVVVLVSLFFVSRHLDSLPHGSSISKTSRAGAAKSRDVLTHLKTKLNFPESSVLKIQPSRETTDIIVPNDHIVVMARLASEDVGWVSGDLAEYVSQYQDPDAHRIFHADNHTSWKYMIYTVDDQSAPHHTPTNKGRESLAYLQYIVDHYYDLPSTIVFLHSHKDGPLAWHNDNDAFSNVDSVRALNMDHVQRNGYANLRCQHSPGCPVSLRPKSPSSSRGNRARNAVERAYSSAWRELFNDTNVPDAVSVPCCSQFAVSRDQVMKRSFADYHSYYSWILDNNLPDNVTSGIMENTWHIIFGQDPVYCPDEVQCYEDVYNVGLETFGSLEV